MMGWCVCVAMWNAHHGQVGKCHTRRIDAIGTHSCCWESWIFRIYLTHTKRALSMENVLRSNKLVYRPTRTVFYMLQLCVCVLWVHPSINTVVSCNIFHGNGDRGSKHKHTHTCTHLNDKRKHPEDEHDFCSQQSFSSAIACLNNRLNLHSETNLMSVIRSISFATVVSGLSLGHIHTNTHTHITHT